MNLDRAAHWAELLSAIISIPAVVGAAWKVITTANAIMHSLHIHQESEGFLRAEKIRRVFTPVRPGRASNEFAP